MAENKSEKRIAKGIYLLPNLLTTTGLFAGFYAVVAAMKGLFDVASIAVFIAMIMDGFDGRVARLTNTESEFGAQYDSLSDMLAFGIAPALVIYSWSLNTLGKLGWLAAFFYAAAAALRLARFNIMHDVSDKRYFQGLPCPAAAGVIAGMVWLGHNNGVPAHTIDFATALVTVAIAGLMVSNIPYYSFKEIDFKGNVPFIAMLLVVLLFVGIAINPPLVLFSGFSCYALSGVLIALIHWRRKPKA